MKGSRRRRSERQRKGERNRDGEIVVVQGGWERKEKPHMFDNCEKWMEMEMIPALTAADRLGIVGGEKKKGNVGERGGTPHNRENRAAHPLISVAVMGRPG